MMKVLTFIGMTIGGSLGSWACGHWGIMGIFMGGIVGTAVGLYAGRKVAQSLGA
jgi:hypothetical protein